MDQKSIKFWVKNKFDCFTADKIMIMVFDEFALSNKIYIYKLFTKGREDVINDARC